jgi:hypothetical protein
MAFDQSGPRGLGISDLIAEPEGSTFISYKVARCRLDRLRFVTQDPIRTLARCIFTTAKLLYVSVAPVGYQTDLPVARACDRW